MRMHSITLALAVGLLVATAASSANASITSDAHIVDVTIEQGTNFARIFLDKDIDSNTTRPTNCHNAGYNHHYGFDISTTKGQALLRTIEAALLSGRKVIATGSTGCTTVATGVTLETLTKFTVFAN